MASNPLFIIPDFFCIFQTNFAMATLGLKEMGKFLWEGREKGLPSWLSQFSFATSFKPKVTIAKFVWKMQKKYENYENYEKWVGCHTSFPPRRSVNEFLLHLLMKNEILSSSNNQYLNMYT